MNFARQAKVAIWGTGLIWLAGLLFALVVQGPWWRALADGLALGLTGSLAVVWSMIRQTQVTASIAGGVVRRGAIFWFVARFAAAAAVVLFALKWRVNVNAAAAGLAVGFVIVMVDGMIRLQRAGKAGDSAD